MTEVENMDGLIENSEGQVDFDKLRRKYDSEARFRTPPGWQQILIALIAFSMSIFHFWTAGWGLLAGQKQGALHLLFALTLVFMLYPIKSSMPKEKKIPIYDWFLAILATVPLTYLITQIDTIAMTRSGLPTPIDITMGFILIALMLEATRRISNPILPVLAIICLLYCYFGASISTDNLFHHRGFTIRRIINHMYLGTEGIFGTPLEVSSTFVFMFILFGAFLDKTGMGRLVIDLSMALAGWATGGPAKVGVVASAMLGCVTGSSIANVCSTGVFTIPLMKSVGYKPSFAGAVEACASTGGQIIPPIMGAAAFIMAQMLGVNFLEVALAAVIPAVLFYVAVMIQVHFEANRMGLKGLPRSMLPNVWFVLREKGFLILPLVVIVYLLVVGYTPLKSAFGAIIVGVVLSWFNCAFRWMLLAITGVSKENIDRLRRIDRREQREDDLSSLVAAGYDEKTINKLLHRVHMEKAGIETLLTPRRIFDAFESGARGALTVACACSCVGIIVGTGTLTGLALKVTGGIIALSTGLATSVDVLTFGIFEFNVIKLTFTLLFTMCASILIGTGLPTTANFIITSTLAAPAVIALGVPPIAAYMFVFYFGISADLTPPVALAAYAASGIAKSDPMTTGLTAFKLALAGLIVPYVYVFNPTLLFIEGTALTVIQSFITAVMGVFLLCMCTIGFYKVRLMWPLRILALVGAVGLMYPGIRTDMMGIVILAIIYAIQTMLSKREKQRLNVA